MAGLIAGVVHVLSGPDHLAAVAPLAVSKGRAGWRAGLQWGVGHCIGVGIVGLFALCLRDLIPITFISSWSERVVGLILLAIGLWGLLRAGRRQVNAPASAPLAIGTIHGLAGSSHIIGVVPGLLFPGALGICAYLMGFAGGTIIAMASFGLCAAALPERGRRAGMMVASCAAVAIGCYWLTA